MNKRWNSPRPSALVLMGVVAFSSGFIAQAQAQSDPVCAALVITGHPSYPPVAWAAEGKIVGAAPDLVSGIAAKLGVKDVVSKDFGSWEAAQQAVRGGQADVIFGIYKNDARALYLDYIEPPFMMDPVSIVVRKGAGFAFAEWSDLKGRKGVTNIGESYGDKFDAFMVKELTVARATGVDKAFEALLAQQADFMIIGLFPGRNEARKLGLIDRIEFLPKELVSAPMYVALSKQSKCGALRTGFSVGIKTAVDADAMRQLLEGADKSLGH
jgi:polar amino acid transport system substrate-binding protein